MLTSFSLDTKALISLTPQALVAAERDDVRTNLLPLHFWYLLTLTGPQHMAANSLELITGHSKSSSSIPL